MNCYYSNLIEGHDTHPIDIERALKNDYSKDVGKRNLQQRLVRPFAKDEEEMTVRANCRRSNGDAYAPGINAFNALMAKWREKGDPGRT
jgi:Zn-finger domain-containing protein